MRLSNSTVSGPSSFLLYPRKLIVTILYISLSLPPFAMSTHDKPSLPVRPPFTSSLPTRPSSSAPPMMPGYNPHQSIPLRPVAPTDDATANSAVRNLKDVLVNGRNLRVESSTDEPGPRRLQGRDGRARREDSPPPRDSRGLPMRDDYPPPSAGRMDTPISHGPGGGVDVNLLPPGQELGGGEKATDVISKTLAAISPGQMQDVMSGMKVGGSWAWRDRDAGGVLMPASCLDTHHDPA